MHYFPSQENEQYQEKIIAELAKESSAPDPLAPNR
jgi:hypothetical protein